MSDAILGRTILVTGAGGSIGSSLAESILEREPGLLVLLDHSERSLYAIDTTLTKRWGGRRHESILGDLCDSELLTEILRCYRPEIIYHVAGYKHVPLMERNPIAAVRNNALGTNLLAIAARAHGVEKLMLVSTDKAVSPLSVMGASKRIGELALLRWATARSRMTAIRLGNVLGSEGSVVPAFVRQISIGGPVTVTHPDVTRYFLTCETAVELILLAAELGMNSGVLVPNLGEPVKILDLAHQKIKEAGLTPEEIAITFTGLRPGDKMSEQFTRTNEFLVSTQDTRLSLAVSDAIQINKFDSGIAKLAEGVQRRDPSAIVEVLCDLVPDYHPSEAVMRLLEHSSTEFR